MLKKILLGLLAFLALFLGYVALKSPEYTVSRSATVHASPEKVYPFVSNSKLMDSWAPWRDIDPQMKAEFSGPDAGVGAKTSWDSPGQMGTGSATVTAAEPNRSVHTHLEYVKPYPMTQEADMTLAPAAGGGTLVTWSVSGRNNFVGRLMCTFMDMDKMVGGMFEKGLAKLSAQVEDQGASGR